MTFATEAVLTTLTRDGRVDRQMNRRSDAAAFDGMEESERKITWRKEMGREKEGRKGVASHFSVLNESWTRKWSIARSLVRSLVPSPFSPFPLYSSFPLPPLSRSFPLSAFSPVAAFRLSLRKPPAQRTNERATLPLQNRSPPPLRGRKNDLTSAAPFGREGGRVRLVITT